MHAWVILSATCFNLTSETGAGLLSVRWSPTVREHELHDVLELQHQLARHLIVSVLKTAALVACCRDYPLPVMPPDPPPCRAPAHPRLPSIRVRLQELSPSWGLKSRQANAFLWETPERLLSSLLPATPAWWSPLTFPLPQHPQTTSWARPGVRLYPEDSFQMSVQRGQYVVSKNYVEELHRH